MTAEQDKSPEQASPLEHEAYAWVVRFVSGEAKAEEIKALKQWADRSTAHAEAFERASRVWKGLDPARFKLLSDASMGRLSGVRSGSTCAPRRPGRRAVLGGTLAASAAAAAVVLVSR